MPDINMASHAALTEILAVLRVLIAFFDTTLFNVSHYALVDAVVKPIAQAQRPTLSLVPSTSASVLREVVQILEDVRAMRVSKSLNVIIAATL